MENHVLTVNLGQRKINILLDVPYPHYRASGYYKRTCTAHSGWP